MLSPYFPIWLVATLSPLLAFLNPYLDPRPNIKPAVLFGLCVVVTAGVIMGTPLDWPDLIQQTIILFGIVAGGYTIAKPTSTIGKKSLALSACILLLGLAGMAQAQDSTLIAADPEAFAPALDPAPITAPVAETANVWLQWGLGLLGGVLGRLISRLRGGA